MKRAFVALVLLLLVALLTGCASGRARSDVDDDGLAWMHAPYKVHAGDDPSWSAPGLDDREWPSFDGRFLPGTTIAGWNGIGWFRGAIEVGPDLVDHPVPLYARFVGAAEVYVDGRRVFAEGDPSAVASGGTTPVSFGIDRPHWVTFHESGRHALAVRFASQRVGALHRIGFPAGFEIAVGPREESAKTSSLADDLLKAAVMGATFALALLHVLLFSFHRDRRENLHYALAALGVAVVAFFDGALRWATTADQTLVLVGGLGGVAAVSTVLLLRFYHAVFSPRVPRSYWIFFGVACAIAAGSWALPRVAAYVFCLIVAVAQFRVLGAAVLRRASGAWIVGVGGSLWLAGAAYQMLGDVGAVPAFSSAYLYGFLALLGSMAVFLARDVARDKAGLRDAMDRYRTVFETAGTGMILFGDDATIRLANEEWSALSGYSRDEMEGRMTWRTFFTEKSLEKMNAYHRLRGRDPSAVPRTYEAQMRDRRGKVRDGVITINVVPGTKERVGSFLDVTDLKRAQRQMVRADKMAALGQIAAGVAHEINNPNNFIHFNLPILRRYVDAMRPILEIELEKKPDLEILHMRYEAFIDDLFKLIDNMAHGSARITTIVSDLKGYIRSGEDLEMKAGSIAKVIDQAMALIGKQVQKTVKRVDVSVPEDLPSVKMNAGRIEQVLINLLINASQAADKDDAWVRVEARATASGEAVEVVVEDNGAGIPADDLEQIFEPFYTTKGRETGTGLGLAISQHIVDEHGGVIEVTSEPGKGSRFVVRLPAAPSVSPSG